MNDLEERIRAVLDEDALGAPRVTRLPDEMRRRVRRTQILTGFTAGGTVGGIAVVLALLAAVLTGRQVPQPAGLLPAGRQVTVIFPEVRISYPDGWQATGTSFGHPPGHAYRPIEVFLTNFDAPDDARNWGWVCTNGTVRGQSGTSRFPDGGVMLSIDVGNGPSGPNAPRWPQSLAKTDQCANYANSPFRGETWTAEWTPDGVTPMSAVAVFGPDASDADHQRIFDTFASLSFPGPARTTSLSYGTEAGAVVASGNDFGHAWMLRDDGKDLTVSVDGVEQGDYVIGSAGTTQIDIGGGTLLISRRPASTGGVRVTADVGGKRPIAEGRWMPTESGDERIWVVALPGEGGGYVLEAGSLPHATSWPTQRTPQPGDVLAAGSDDQISWALRWTDQGCPIVDLVYSVNGDTGTSDCLVPWDGDDPAVGGVYGQHDAAVIVTGPANMLCDVSDPSGQVAGGISGGTVAQVGAWAHTGSCTVTIPVGDTVTITITDQHGTPIPMQNGTVRVTAKPGRLVVG